VSTGSKWQVSLNIENNEYFSRYPSDATKFIPITKAVELAFHMISNGWINPLY
jgi:hypothetical protein